jgi:ADP-heptose:LPS heptosyltransferase
MELNKENKIALIPGNRIGDDLIAMVLAYNIAKNGFDVTIFSSIIYGLKEIFPKYKIEKFPGIKNAKKALSKYDILIYQHNDNMSKDSSFPYSQNQKKLILYGAPIYMKTKNLVDVYVDVCEDILKLSKIKRSNGVIYPKSSMFRIYKNRVIIHPTSCDITRSWPRDKFLKVADWLIKKGYDPVFVVSPLEECDWNNIATKYKLKVFDKLINLAHYIYESGYMIGNDSGVGHLASTLAIPTITLCMRPKIAKRWQPAFSPNIILLPCLPLPGPQLKLLLWTKLISCSRIFRAFRKMIIEIP